LPITLGVLRKVRRVARRRTTRIMAVLFKFKAKICRQPSARSDLNALFSRTLSLTGINVNIYAM
jgi:hypothetical protein